MKEYYKIKKFFHNFEKTVDSLFINKDVDLYITGSNAWLLSSELTTLLTGRYIEIKMLPLLFKEYLLALADRTDLSRKFRDYLKYSSYNTVSTYVQALIDSYIVYKASRYDIKGKEFLKTQEKYYAVDIGLRYYMLGQGSGKDMGHILENVVYL